MLDVQPSALRSTLEQLDQAMQEHLEWHANLLRVIVCELPGDPNDVSPQAHHLCRFGQWYYHRAPVALRKQPTYVAIGIEHRQVHLLATRMLGDLVAGRAVHRETFDDLMAASQRLRRELDLFRRELQAALRSRDALTGALDREQVVPELRRWRPPASPEPVPCCIVSIDIDDLQQVNDAHGHLVGDAVLAEAVRVVREHLRPDDEVFRYGGDEFLIVLPRADLALGRQITGCIREGLAGRQLTVAGTELGLRFTASFGIAEVEPGIRVEDSIEHALQALLLAKTSGGNRAIAWDATAVTGRHWRRLELDEQQMGLVGDGRSTTPRDRR